MPAIQGGPVWSKDGDEAAAVALIVTISQRNRVKTSVGIALHCITDIIFFVCVELLAINIDRVA
jgi:hypothetical protein